MLKAALLGCGRWGHNHLRVLSSLREQGLIESIAVVDTSEAARLSAKSADYTSPTMEGIDADFVVIATPFTITLISSTRTARKQSARTRREAIGLL